ncbi:MAG: hypothetical protein JWR80_1577 [Bradyrhizobium sp.]|nr:hypothetical protein [Bradyrhizobium sp.]
MYEIAEDMGQGLIAVKVSGFWNVATATRYAEDLAAAIVRMRKRHAEFLLLVDMREAGTLPQDAAQVIEAAIANQLANGIKRSANVVSSTLAEIQIKRLSQRDEKYRYFADIDEAKAWLLGE